MDEKKQVNVPVILLLVLLLCSVGYIGYDKFVAKEEKSESVSEKVKADSKKENKEETKEENNNPTIKYNKDGLFVKQLMDKIYKRTTTGLEEALYAKDVVKIEDLDTKYLNELVITNMPTSDTFFSKKEFDDTAYMLFGKTLNIGSKIDSLCGVSYILSEGGHWYEKHNSEDGCGGTGFRYINKVVKVENDANHIYVYQKKGFQKGDEICKNIQKNSYGYYEGVNPLKKVSFEDNDEKITEELLDRLNEYKFTFTYDENNNIYYFEKVERVS